ncbi:MAG: uroporphyrinogen-III synthase [Acidobacteriaceae bacterium]|jgi:uroporphyrinogen-III synthase|nr:uroporphyrinogen-III synthase [Acidobacteriaceae bacterium]
MTEKNTGFRGLRVLSLESRRSREIGLLISNNGGVPVVAPSTREVPSGPNPEELKFASGLLKDQFAIVIFMTGVGTRALLQAIESVCPREQFVAAMSRAKVVARGPKPTAVLRELEVPIALTVPEPNTWREILQALDANAEKLPLNGVGVAVQEHGEPSPELYAGLKERGADVFPVPVYQWALPEDTIPLRNAINALTKNQIDVSLFTSSIQLRHLLRIAEEMQLREEVVHALNETIVASIGPVTSETLRENGIKVSMEPSHPKMGFLVKEAAEQSADLLRKE